MKLYPNQIKPSTDYVVSDVSIDNLLDRGLTILQREMHHLAQVSAKSKLAPADARDLRDNIKLLFELKDREKDGLKGLTDEQLKIITDALGHGSNK